MNLLAVQWYNWAMDSNRYPTGYLAAADAFLAASGQHDPIAAPRPRVQPQPPQLRAVTGRARLAASFTVIVVTSLGPLAALIVSLWS